MRDPSWRGLILSAHRTRALVVRPDTHLVGVWDVMHERWILERVFDRPVLGCVLTRCGLLAVRLDQGGTSRWAFHPPPWTSEPAWTTEGTLLTEGTVLGQEVLCVGGRGVQRRPEVGVFSAESGRLLHTLPGHAAQVCEDFAVALPHGRTVGHLGIGGALTREVWTQRERFDGDAAQLACGPRSGVKCFSGMLGVHGFSYEDGRPTWHLPRGPGAQSVTWSPDERVFVVWSLTGVLTVAEDGRVASEWDWPAAAGGPCFLLDDDLLLSPRGAVVRRTTGSVVGRVPIDG